MSTHKWEVGMRVARIHDGRVHKDPLTVIAVNASRVQTNNGEWWVARTGERSPASKSSWGHSTIIETWTRRHDDGLLDQKKTAETYDMRIRMGLWLRAASHEDLRRIADLAASIRPLPEVPR